MKKFLASLFPSWINDKGKHAILGTLIYLVNWAIFGKHYALAITYAAGIGTEIYDKVSGDGESDYKDAFWTVLPATIIYLITILWQD